MPLLIYVGVLIAIVLVVVILKAVLEGGRTKEKPAYRYTRKQFFLTAAERDCFNALVLAAGTEFHVFAQVHLPTILDHTVRGQDWRAALAHINRKSVDFVLCDKERLAPLLAIELDDRSHERPDRQTQDREVERILEEAGMPLLRLQNHASFDPVELAEKVRNAVKGGN